MIRSLDAQPAQHRVVWGLRSSADWRLEAGCIGSCQSPPAMAARQVGAMQALRRRPRPGQGPPKAPLQVRWRAVIGTGRHAFGFTWDHKTGWHTSSRQAAQSLPLGPACAPTSAASTSLCARLRPERSSAIHLPVGSILCSSCGVFCSISQRLHHSTFPPLLTPPRAACGLPPPLCGWSCLRLHSPFLLSHPPHTRWTSHTHRSRVHWRLFSPTHINLTCCRSSATRSPPRRASRTRPDGASSDESSKGHLSPACA